jgi:hypothetical protein
MNIDEETKKKLYKCTIHAHSVNNEQEYQRMLINCDKPCYIRLKNSNAGFWSIFNKLMNYLLYYKNIRRIDFDSLYLNSSFKDAFDIISNEPTSNEYLYEINANTYITYEATGCYANWLHISKQDWRKKYNTLFNTHFRMSQLVKNELLLYEAQLKNIKDKKIISILFRHKALSHEQINGKMPEYHQYDSIIEKILKENNNNCAFILATDVIEAELYFKNKYAMYDLIHPYSTKTSQSSHQESHTISSAHFHKNMAVVAASTVFLLSKGDYFIYPNSNMATAVLYINTTIIPCFLIGK